MQLRQGEIARDNADFMARQSVAASLTAGRADLAALFTLATGVEVRSKAGGSLRVGADWDLSAGATTPGVVTLRADGDLLVSYSLSSGFKGLGAASAPLGGPSASLRLVGGADRAAADPLAVQAGGQGDVVLGRAGPNAFSPSPTVLVRSTSGDIDIAAARDVRSFSTATGADGNPTRIAHQARVYTTGTPLGATQTPGLAALGIRVDQFLRDGLATVGPFFVGAGDISLAAGRDLLGTPASIAGDAGRVQYATDWWYRQGNTTVDPAGGAFWSRYDRFAQGVASFGGGDLRARAGRDIQDLDLSTPFSGYFVPGTEAAGRWFPGGTLDVRAGGSLTGGLFFGGGPRASIAAGGALVAGANAAWPDGYAAPQVLYGDTTLSITARTGLAMAAPASPELMNGAAQGNERQPRTDAIVHLTGNASATLVSLSGDVDLTAARPAGSTTGNDPGIGARIVPDTLRVAAPAGSVRAGTLAQLPQGDSALEIFAARDVEAESLQVVAPVAADAAPRPLDPAAMESLFNVRTREWTQLGDGAAAPAGPVRLVAQDGRLALTGSTAFVANALRLVAGQDIVLTPQLSLQHPPGDAAATTLLQAGRDLRFAVTGGIRLGGGGDMVAIATRDIDMGRGNGIVSVGNQDNDLQLPRGGAGLTLLAGVTLDDYRQAAAQQFQLLGGGFENHASRLLVQLEALAAGRPLLGGADLQRAAEAFDAQPLETQQARVATIVGADALAQQRGADVEAMVAQLLQLSAEATQAVRDGRVTGSDRGGPAGPVPGGELVGGARYPERATAAERAALEALALDQLRDALQSRALGVALARHVGTLDDAARQSLALAVSPYTGALTQFVQQRTGRAPADGAAAQAAFQALAPEQQAVFLNQVLASELRDAGRGALAGDRTAHLRGYAAMDTLFPGARPAGRITLSNSQVKTAQGGDIRLAAPGGSVNVGDLAGSGVVKSVSDVGIVTVAGGQIAAAVRDSVEVNQSRVFTLAEGDVLLWARLGNLDAGRGAKTVVGAPPPIVTFNAQGQLVVDTSGSFSGSGIAALAAGSALDLYAPLGEISAGEAGIRAAGRVFLDATRLVNVNDIQAPQVLGAPPPPPVAATAGLAGIASAATAASTQVAAAPRDEEDERRRQRPRRNLFLDFLGFGRGE